MKKFLSVILALAMLVTVTPVFAEETSTETDGSETTTEFVPSAENYDALENSAKITESWKIIAGNPTPASGNFYSTKFVDGNMMVYKVALPAPANGQTYDKLVLRFGVGSNGGGAYKMPGENWDMSQSLAGSDWYTKITSQTNASTLKAYSDSIIYGEVAHGYKNAYADITEYAKDCWYAGQNYMYLVAGCVASTSGACQSSVSDSSYRQFAPTILYSFKTVEAPTPIENTAEAMVALGNETVIPAANGYKSAAGTVTAASGHWTSTYISGAKKGNFAIVKIDLPKIPAGKTLANFAFRYGVSNGKADVNGNYTMASNLRVYKMPGTDWSFPGSIASTDWYNEIVIASTAKAYEANDNSIVYTDGINGSKAYTLAYSDITSYIKECYAKGQTYCYLAYGDWNSTRNTGSTTTTDSSYVQAGVKPAFYYSLADMGALELASSPANGEITDATTATFSFNNKLKDATATINGVEADCTVVYDTVTVDLGEPGKKTVVVTATDTARNTVTTDAVTIRAGYNSHKITSSDNITYVVNNSGSTAATYTPSVNSGASTVLTIPLPELSAGQTLGEFNLRFLMTGSYSPSYFRLFKIPVDASQIANLIQTSGETPEGKINIYEYQQAAAGEYKADFGSFESELYNTGVVDVNAGHADLTKYAKECIERGQTKMLVGFTSVYSNSLIGVGDSTHTTANRFHYSYWTVEDTDFSAKAPKFVASDDVNTFANATGLASLAKAAEYKFITSLANFGAEDASVTLYIAQYADGELIGITPKTVTVTANGEATDFTSANFTVDALAENVKAFIWNDAEQKPMLIGDVVVDAK